MDTELLDLEMSKLDLTILDISEECYNLLLTYKSKSNIRKYLKRIKDKDVEGYGHLSDVDIIYIGDRYFTLEIYNYYYDVEDWFRNKETMTSLSKRFGVDRSTVVIWLKYDKILNQHRKTGERTGVLGAKSVLSKMIEGFIGIDGSYVPPNFNALRLYLLNAASDEFKDEKFINSTSSSSVDLKVDKLIDGMSDEELRRFIDSD